MTSEVALDPQDYFSSEDYFKQYRKGYGLEEYLRMYNGGLGVLAGHLANAFADLGLPVAIMTLLYPQGFGRQRISPDGWQIWEENPVDPSRHFERLEKLVTHRFGRQVIEIDDLHSNIVGRNREGPRYAIPLDELDATRACNPEKMKGAGRLYQGDIENKLCQEFALGVGGVMAARKLYGDSVKIFHMNDSHPALGLIELYYEQFRQGLSFDEAAKRVGKQVVLTTHTPVAAAFHKYPYSMVENIFGGALDPKIGSVLRSFNNDELSLGFLAMMGAGKINAVAHQNAIVAQHLDELVASQRYKPGFVHWDLDYPLLQPGQWSVAPITNGVDHVNVVSQPFQKLYDAKLGNWIDYPEKAANARRLLQSHEVWDAHKNSKVQFFDYLANEFGARLDPDALTIGYARRFAPYKRADLAFTDMERLKSIGRAYYQATGGENGGKRMQVVMAGLAHPDDWQGQAILHNVYLKGNSLNSEPYIKFVFMPDYRLSNSLLMVGGVDVWLNTPFRPEEASGTSGMKAGMNGVINLSTLDGWWAEAYAMMPTAGWAIGGEPMGNVDRDLWQKFWEEDAKSLYDTLEYQVLPAYVKSVHQHTSSEWYDKMKDEIALCLANFNTLIVAKQYASQMWGLGEPGLEEKTMRYSIQVPKPVPTPQQAPVPVYEPA